jgi:hypothetical protein
MHAETGSLFVEHENLSVTKETKDRLPNNLRQLLYCCKRRVVLYVYLSRLCNIEWKGKCDNEFRRLWKEGFLS